MGLFPMPTGDTRAGVALSRAHSSVLLRGMYICATLCGSKQVKGFFYRRKIESRRRPIRSSSDRPSYFNSDSNRTFVKVICFALSRFLNLYTFSPPLPNACAVF